MVAPFFYWLAGFVALGLACLFLRHEIWQEKCRSALLIYVSAFVFWTLTSSIGLQGRLTHSSVAIESDRAELMLKIGNAMYVCERFFPSSAGGGIPGQSSSSKAFEAQTKNFYQEAAKSLDGCLNDNPDSTLLRAKLAIVQFQEGSPQAKKQAMELAGELAGRQVKKDKELGVALKKIFAHKKLSPGEEPALLKTVEGALQPGWFRDACLLNLYEAAGDKTHYKELRDSIEQKTAGMLLNGVYILVVGLVVIVIGLIVIVVQLFLFPGREAAMRNDAYWREAQPWNLKTVYLVFIAWLATEISSGSLAQYLVKTSGLSGGGPLAVAVGTAGSYLAGNAPGLFYIYWFACRPYQHDFLTYIKLRLIPGRLGPVKLVLIGFATWCAALPIVCLASVLSSKFLGSQGSSNPIITLVLDAARSSNGAAIVLFYMTLGVFAPLCEESLFRGFLYANLRRRFGMGVSLIVSASLFAAAHLDPGAIVQLLCLGLVFGFVFEKTKSLIPSMIAHGLWNSGSFTVMLLLFGN